MPKLSKSDARNIQTAMVFCNSNTARRYAQNCKWYVTELLKHIALSHEIVQRLLGPAESELEATVACTEIFRNGWLSPTGNFIVVPYAMHEQTVSEVTGYRDCDTACGHDWVKFTLGHPHNYDAEFLFEPGENKTRFTPPQVVWLNEWLTRLAGEDVVLVL